MGIWYKFSSCGDASHFFFFFHVPLSLFVTFLALFCGYQALRPFHFLLCRSTLSWICATSLQIAQWGAGLKRILSIL